MRSAIAMSAILDALGTPPTASNNYMAAVENTPCDMYGNNQWGDCLTEGTVVDGKNIAAAYKAKYKGPIVRLLCASGKRLAITPKHAVLTPRGFVCAKDLKKGDDLVGTSRPQIFPSTRSGGNGYLDYAPAPVEQIFSALALRRALVREIMPVPVHFHGDGKFLNGNIQIVGTDSFLSDEFDTTLSQPNGKNEIGTTSKLQRRFHGTRTAFLRFFRSLAPALGDVCFGCDGTLLAYGHAGVAKSKGQSLGSHSISRGNDSFGHGLPSNPEIFADALQRLAGNVASNCLAKISSLPDPTNVLSRAAGANIHASRDHPSSDGVPTDPELCSHLFRSLSGLVECDRLVDVEVDALEGHIFDLSTESRWYVANGLITHNCVEADTAHTLTIRTANASSATVIPTITDVFNLYEDFGFRPNQNIDPGTSELAMLQYLKAAGFLGHKLDNSATIDPGNIDHVKWSIQLFGGCRFGWALPDYAEQQFMYRQPWDVQGGSQSQRRRPRHAASALRGRHVLYDDMGPLDAAGYGSVHQDFCWRSARRALLRLDQRAGRVAIRPRSRDAGTKAAGGCSMRMSWNYALIVAVIAIVLIVVVRYALSAGGNPLSIQMIERREGVWPGKTTVWPDCNCSVRYVGTIVHGNRYTIVIDKLD